jgi:hypothetical protein
MLYARLLEFQGHIDGGRSREAEAAPLQSDHDMQSVGNCTLKNHSAGMWARLCAAVGDGVGPALGADDVTRATQGVWRWFKDQERALIIDRICRFAITPDALRKRYEDQKVTRLSALCRDEKARHGARLQRFLDKPGREAIAASLKAEDLAAVVRAGDLQAMQQLINHGADIQGAGKVDGTTLLHLAIGTGNAELITLLLQHGADPAATDKEERTPYALAKGLRSGPALAALAAHGDAYEMDDADLLRQQIAAMQAALRTLESRAAAMTPPGTPLLEGPAAPGAPVPPLPVACEAGEPETKRPRVTV